MLALKEDLFDVSCFAQSKCSALLCVFKSSVKCVHVRVFLALFLCRVACCCSVKGVRGLCKKRQDCGDWNLLLDFIKHTYTFCTDARSFVSVCHCTASLHESEYLRTSREQDAGLYSGISKQLSAGDRPNYCRFPLLHRNAHMLQHSGIERNETLRHKNTHTHTHLPCGAC